ncbi:hydrogenase maturation protease [Nannocystis bainbridge]|uniref:Hydrogenase maturation protease n=1 Tax=Nannocystis bainbridge TaxID=2995303 RepID=A0ABT5E4R8_9BACT|nr:hydrogenase maturation protease [Nannocystis bainbridge]MDC0720862.1 hydrogenase maturation protease [Nannocystis bainbridge]
MSARVIGVGQRLAGDDGVGIRVAERLRSLDLDDVQVDFVASTTELIARLTGVDRVIVVDAVLGSGALGHLHVATPEDFDAQQLVAISTHGLDLPAAVALARALYPESVAPEIQIVGLEIERPERLAEELSLTAAAAVEAAVRAVVAMLGENTSGGHECTSHPSPGKF